MECTSTLPFSGAVVVAGAPDWSSNDKAPQKKKGKLLIVLEFWESAEYHINVARQQDSLRHDRIPVPKDHA